MVKTIIENYTKITMPEWMNDKIAYPSKNTYKQVWDKYLISFQSLGYLYSDYTPEELDTILNSQIYAGSTNYHTEPMDGVDYGYEIEQRIASGKKLLKSQQETVTRKNAEINERGWDILTKLLAKEFPCDSSEEKPSLVMILKRTLESLKKGVSKAQADVRELTVPLYMKEQSIESFCDRSIENYYHSKTGLYYFKNAVEDLSAALYEITFPLQAKGLEGSGRGWYLGIADRYQYSAGEGIRSGLKTMVAERLGMTYWDFIRHVLELVDGVSREYAREYKKMTESVISRAFNKSTNVLHNVFEDLQKVATISALGSLCWLYKTIDGDMYGVKHTLSFETDSDGCPAARWHDGYLVNLDDIYVAETEEEEAA